MLVVTFYKFIELENLEELRDRALSFCQQQNLKGTILLASEGINATLSGEQENLDNFIHFLKQDQRFADIQPKFSESDNPPFHRMKVKIKPEIVTMGVEEINPKITTGQHIDPETWNKLITDPEVLVIDTRNEYEYKVGTFQNAISPKTDHFREFPEFVEENLDPKQHKKIAMFCTGGIRCEKASAYLKEQGFEEVYQLNGGILNYLDSISPEESLWQGECFVFDHRVAVNENLEKGNHEICYGCRHPLSPEDRKSEKYQPGVSCPYCYDQLTKEQRDRFAERWRQEQIARQRQQKHVGAEMPQQSYNF
ncbi:rhodanese-related sulfurtransferase [Euhalothece natronophila Z-M001]|uniref:tRNA uridine(34) hydroxylase n=1 Tax=Euhalothece natronophila Z-M001 TaxID=522448 RepID=A0A5B8NN86_9CHRO|nr:rhodanese-related sulfurtransferase [Euhalothece natronophila]QDZ39700.1 rhodanese-related sulfurtransferase [Euhalothece natronophila Z-M001]